MLPCVNFPATARLSCLTFFKTKTNTKTAVIAKCRSKQNQVSESGNRHSMSKPKVNLKPQFLLTNLRLLLRTCRYLLRQLHDECTSSSPLLTRFHYNVADDYISILTIYQDSPDEYL